MIPRSVGFSACALDLRRWLPNDVLSAKGFALENEVVQSSRMIASITRLRPFADSDLNSLLGVFQGPSHSYHVLIRECPLDFHLLLVFLLGPKTVVDHGEPQPFRTE